MDKTALYKSVFKKYLPPQSVDAAVELFINKPIYVQIKQARSTKLGDFKAPVNGMPTRITINGDLNPYAFLITLVHELAHWTVWNTYPNYRNLKPHGAEWKATFSRLMGPFLSPRIFPEDLLPIIGQHMLNPGASTSSDIVLMQKLKEYDLKKSDPFLFEFSEGDSFIFKGRKFQIIKKNRTRFLCLDILSKRKFLVHSQCEVQGVPN